MGKVIQFPGGERRVRMFQAELRRIEIVRQRMKCGLPVLNAHEALIRRNIEVCDKWVKSGT